MSKIGYALVSVVIVELGLYMFTGSTNILTSITQLVMNPSTITSQPFYTQFAALFALLGTVTIIVGTFTNFNTFFIYGGASLWLLSFAQVFGDLGSQVYSLVAPYNTSLAVLITAILVGPLTVFYITTVVDWARSNL